MSQRLAIRIPRARVGEPEVLWLAVARNGYSPRTRGVNPDGARQDRGLFGIPRASGDEDQDEACAPRTRSVDEGSPLRYAIVLEATETGYSAYAPDLPGCVATAERILAVEQALREAIALHLEGLRKDGLVPPKPASQVRYVDIVGRLKPH